MEDQKYPREGLIFCNLKELMDERRLTVAELSRVTGLSRPTVRNCRDNRFEGLSMVTVARLCSVLKVGVGVLLSHKTSNQLEAENRALVGARK